MLIKLFCESKLKRRIQAINDTKIKYLSISGKVYKVTSINCQRLTLEAKETDLSVDDVKESELWDISYFEDYEIRLVNGKGKIKIVDMAEWLEEHGLAE